MVEAFSQAKVARITGLTERQLGYWDELDLIRPSIAPKGGRGEPRLYSFLDLMRLKVAYQLRDLQERPSDMKLLWEALEARGYRDPFVTVTFGATTDGRKAIYVEPTSGEALSAHRGEIDQQVETFGLALKEIRTGLERSIADLARRKPGTVTQLRTVQSNAPVIGGTRVPTAKIFDLTHAGWDHARILEAFPHLVEQDIAAAIIYERGRREARSA
jgi:uncharacterized protein (DUF433 family)/DNA-binding transcriptional MerR regulator